MRGPDGRFPKGTGAGSGGIAKGAGWGGPAKGASTSRIKPGDPDGITSMRHDPDNKRRQAERVEAVREHLFGLALNAERQETQLAASVAYLNRIEGTPLQRAVVANVADPSKLTDADLAAIAAGSGPAAPPAPDDPAEPGGVVH
jgi:hypothetical protein